MFDKKELILLRDSLLHIMTHINFSKSDMNFEDFKNLYHKIKNTLEMFPDLDNTDYSIATISDKDFWELLGE